MEEPIATLEEGTCRAEVYETEMPGQFTIRYLRSGGEVMAEEALTGVSTYRQRELEIRHHLTELCAGAAIDTSKLSDSGEY